MSFIAFTVKDLGITTPYKIKPSDDHSQFDTFAYYDPETKEVHVYTKNRAFMDICRSIAHELVHHRQNEEKRLEGDVPNIGGEIEDEANAVAGQIMKKFGKQSDPKVYEL